jgi:hypothetical protein
MTCLCEHLDFTSEVHEVLGEVLNMPFDTADMR